MKNSKNLKEFFANTSGRFKGKVGYAFMATLISVFPFMLILFGAAWLSQLVHGLFGVIAIIAVICIGCAQVGHIRFIRQLANGENPGLGVLYSGFKEKSTLFYLFLGIVQFVIYLFAGILLVVPLFFAIGAFSMVFYFVEHHKYDTLLDALSVTEKRMRRQKGNMFAYKSMFYIAYFLLLVVFVISLVFILTIKATAVAYILVVLLHLLFYVAFSYITTLFSFCNYNFFMEVLEYHERKSKSGKVVQPEIPQVEETLVEEETITKVQLQEEKPKKVASTKTATTKTATKKPATKSTTTKTTTKKPATKKEEK